ncbi:hypothetical protein GN958_ATG01216 [Phytophthora infestans]|uniref:Uncharacterized protein n=1 Tax=Phytophthora infestans TaxID=4787 RepID=A0A8S9VE53_PHYIN|nr:hypothetical protein GN958_ATG01216 [Phytophthora infestans]
MLSHVGAPEVDVPPAPAAEKTPSTFPEDLMYFIEDDDGVDQATSRDVQEARAEEELKRWLAEPVVMNRH